MWKLLKYYVRQQKRGLLVITIVSVIITSLFTIMSSKLEMVEANNIQINNKELYLYDVDNSVDISGFTKESPFVFNKSNLPTYQASLASGEEFTIYPDVTNQLIKDNNLPNVSYQFTSYLGHYPNSASDIMLGDELAGELLKEQGLTDISELINQEISLQVDEEVIKFNVCGIIINSDLALLSQDNDLFQNQDFTLPLNSYYEEFDSKQDKVNFINDNSSNIKYYDSSFVSKSYQKIITSVYLIILLFSLIYYFKLIYKEDFKVFRHYYRYKAAIYLIIPIVIYILNAIYCYSLYK